MLDLEFRVPYGVNNTGPGSGVLPDLVPTSSPRVIKTDSQRRVAFLPGGLGVGSTLYIPVFNEGALFFTGDPHGAAA